MFMMRMRMKTGFVIGCVLCMTQGFFSGATAQTIVDKNKGTHYEARKGLMNGNLVSTIYYNFSEIADWKNDPSNSGVWPKGTNHTYVDGVAVIVQAETQILREIPFIPLKRITTNIHERTLR